MRLSRATPDRVEMAAAAMSVAVSDHPAGQAGAAKFDAEMKAVAPDMLAVGSPMPKSLGRCADFLHDVRELRLLMDKDVAKIKSRETEIQEHIINNLSSSLDTGAAGLKYRAQVVKETVPQVSEEKGGWAAVWKFIAKNNRFDLLQKRLGEKAITDMWAQGEEVPGVAKVHVPKLSITKI